MLHHLFFVKLFRFLTLFQCLSFQSHPLLCFFFQNFIHVSSLSAESVVKMLRSLTFNSATAALSAVIIQNKEPLSSSLFDKFKMTLFYNVKCSLSMQLLCGHAVINLFRYLFFIKRRDKQRVFIRRYSLH